MLEPRSAAIMSLFFVCSMVLAAEVHGTAAQQTADQPTGGWISFGRIPLEHTSAIPSSLSSLQINQNSHSQANPGIQSSPPPPAPPPSSPPSSPLNSQPPSSQQSFPLSVQPPPMSGFQPRPMSGIQPASGGVSFPISFPIRLGNQGIAAGDLFNQIGMPPVSLPTTLLLQSPPIVQHSGFRSPSPFTVALPPMAHMLPPPVAALPQMASPMPATPSPATQCTPCQCACLSPGSAAPKRSRVIRVYRNRTPNVTNMAADATNPSHTRAQARLHRSQSSYPSTALISYQRPSSSFSSSPAPPPTRLSPPTHHTAHHHHHHSSHRVSQKGHKSRVTGSSIQEIIANQLAEQTSLSPSHQQAERETLTTSGSILGETYHISGWSLADRRKNENSFI